MSREAELYKDKIEVSLDGRQIFYLFFGGSVIVGLVFVLGVMVGRRVEARGHVDRARISAAVDPLAALDHLEGGNGLSFQGALRGNDGPVSDVEKQIAAMEAKPADAKGDKGKKVEPKVLPKVEPKTEAKTEAKTDAKTDAKTEAKTDAKTEAKSEPKAEDKKKTEAKAQVKTEAKSEAKTEAKKSEKKDVAVLEPKKDEPKKEEKKQKFTLQLSSFQDKKDAEALADSVKAAGFEAYITEGLVDGKQYFRVRTGTYKTLEAAQAARGEIEKIASKSAIVTKL